MLCAGSFAWGVLASFTPCVFPMHLATVAAFMADDDAAAVETGTAASSIKRPPRKRRRLGFVLLRSAIFALGIAISFSLLGTLVSLAVVEAA